MLSLRLVWSAFRARPAKTAFSILGIGLGVATAVAILTLDETTVLAKVIARTEEFAKVDLEVTPADPAIGPLAALERLRAVPGVATVGAISQGSVNILVGGRFVGSAKLVALDEVARTAPAFDAYRVETGSDLPPTDSGAPAAECLLGGPVAESTRLRAGASIELVQPKVGRNGAICINGVLYDAAADPDAASIPEPKPVPVSVAGVLHRYHLGKQAGGSVVIVPLPLVERILPNHRGSTLYWITKDPKVSSEQLKAALTPEFAYSNERTALIGESADERAFRNGVRVSGVLALLLGLFVIFHTLSMSLVERVKEIAVLNSLGATRGQIGRAFFLEGLLVAVAGAVLGVAMGIGLARLALLAGYTTLGRRGGIDLLQISWGPALAIAGVGVVVALMGSIFPLVKARAIYPARVLAQRDLGKPTDLFRGLNVFMFAILAVLLPVLYFFFIPVLGEGSRDTGRVLIMGGMLFAVFLGFLLLAPKALAWVCDLVTRPFERIWPLEGFLSARSMAEGIPRVATSAAVVALVASALITIKGITTSLQGEVVSWGRTVEHKLFVQAETGAYPRDRVERLTAVPGILGFEALGTEIQSPFLIHGIRAADAGFTGPFRDAEIAKRFEESESLLVSTPLARALHMRVGQEVPIGIPAGPPRLFRVLAISDELGYFPPRREFAVMSDTWMKKYFCLKSDEWIPRFALRMEDGADPDATKTAVASALADLPKPTIQTGISRRDFEIEDIDRDFRLFDLILGLVAILAGIGVLNALLIAAFERRKEIGVLKAIGMTGRQLAGSVVVEAGTTGVLGGLFGALLGSAFLWIAIDALARLTGLPLATTHSALWIFLAFLGGVLLSVLASIFPVLRANQFSAAEAVRYE